jgi:hypothetical protein
VPEGNERPFGPVSATEIWGVVLIAGFIDRADGLATDRNSKNKANSGAMSS